MELCFVHLFNDNSYKMYSFYLFSTIFEKHSNIKDNNLKITHCTYLQGVSKFANSEFRAW
jgi:hypothetical protein